MGKRPDAGGGPAKQGEPPRRVRRDQQCVDEHAEERLEQPVLIEQGFDGEKRKFEDDAARIAQSPLETLREQVHNTPEPRRGRVVSGDYGVGKRRPHGSATHVSPVNNAVMRGVEHDRESGRLPEKREVRDEPLVEPK